MVDHESDEEVRVPALLDAVSAAEASRADPGTPDKAGSALRWLSFSAYLLATVLFWPAIFLSYASLQIPETSGDALLYPIAVAFVVGAGWILGRAARERRRQ